MTYVDTLSKFGVKLDGRNQRVNYQHQTNRFRARFLGFGGNQGADEITMDMKSFNTPKGSFEQKTIDTVNGEIKYLGKWTWQNVGFVVYDSIDNRDLKQLYNQIQIQRNLSQQVTGTVPQNWKFTSIFEYLDGHQNTIGSWVMEGCQLLKAEPGDGDYSNWELMTINCEMTIDNANLYDADNSLITDSGAISTLVSKVLAT